MTSVQLRIVLGVLGAVLAGCDAGNSGADTAVVRDSAGVRIVENHAPAWSEEDAWEVDPSPAVTIGVMDGDQNYLLTEVVGVARLSDGRILVVNGGTAELRFYDSDGAFVAAAGGQGRGPGEIAGVPLQFLLSSGDTIVVLDMPSWNVVRFDGRGTYIDRRQLDRGIVVAQVPPGSHSESVSLLPGGGFMAPVNEIPPRPEPAGHRRPGGYLVVSAAGETTFLEPFPYYDYRSFEFGRRSLFAIGPQSLALGDNETYEISLYSPSGELTRRVRNMRPNRVVTSEDLAGVRAKLVGNALTPEQQSEWAKDFDEADHAETFPAFSALFIDRLGCLWVRQHPPVEVDADTPVGWDIYDPDGIFLGELSLPASLRLHDAGEDYVLGVKYDEMGVERVQLYPLTRG